MVAVEEPKGEADALDPNETDEPKRAEALVLKGDAEALGPKGDAAVPEKKWGNGFGLLWQYGHPPPTKVHPMHTHIHANKSTQTDTYAHTHPHTPVAADAPKRPEPLLTPKVEFEAEKADPAAAVVVVNGLPDGSLVAAAEEAKGEPPELELEPALEPNRELLVAAEPSGMYRIPFGAGIEWRRRDH